MEDLMKKYRAEGEKLQNQKEKFEEELSQEQKKLEGLEDDYSAHVSKLEFDQAEKVKQQKENVKSRISTLEDFIKRLDPSKPENMLDQAIDVINKYADQKEDLLKKGKKLEGKIEAKKQEYLQLLEEIEQVNEDYRKLKGQVRPLANRYDWSTVEGLKIQPRAEFFDNGYAQLFNKQKYEINTKPNAVVHGGGIF
ncbi:hypothetical protein [Virgibacillus dokdonensis]|uniref:hypothetical protein n=1 Tax=Virgibacillus dokdonensis TaxID=302167 RepID=UPI00098AA42D|nr:hypothetical protein [Virgibacillus dokdonensis]